jgi:PAS domain S-box-containing protein
VGRSREDILGRTDYDLFPESLAASYQADDRRVIETGEPHEAVETHRASDAALYVQTVKTPILDAAGRVIGVQCVFWDVTERHRLEEELHQERALLRALLDTCPDSIYFKDRESRFLRVSAALATRVGESASELIGKTDADLFSMPHALAALADERRIMETGEPVIAKLEHEVWRDGRETWASSTKLPMRNARGDIIGTLGVTRDITDLKVAERDLEIARDVAIESARFKATFLANMSHEIRTPLNAVVGMSGLLLDTSLTAEQRDFAETVRTSADCLLDIVNDILDFSKLEAGKVHTEAIDFDLARAIDDSADLLADRAQRKNLELVIDTDPAAPRLLVGDPGRFRQILVNLISNAVKFTEQGEVVISARVVGETADAVTLRFSVRDTGIGIPAAVQPRLFNAFTQGDGSTTRRYGGTGLGLAICRQLVSLMGGTIELESTPGAGSTFSFTLPFARQTGAAETPQVDPETLAGARVLIVDDNETNRLILHHQIIAWKMRNGSASSGPDALALLYRAASEGDPYRAVILDMQMPDMDGIAVARAIKADPRIAETRIVVLTSLAYHPDESIFRRIGIAGYLTKPVKQSRLLDCLANVLGTEARRPAPVRPPADPPPARRPLRILLAEDNAVNRKVALSLLEKIGYSADAVADGDEAVRAVQQSRYDLILMDCQMPRVDGYEATRRIREWEASQGRRHFIIALTANSLSGDRDKCLSAGMDDYASKPIRRDELAAVLERGEVALTKVSEAASRRAN